jgi:hypothetical protein
MMLEHAWMALQAHDYLGEDISKDLPWIEGTVKFFDTFYRAECKRRTGRETGADGKLVIYPANGLELSIGATDPIEEVAGLRRITSGLLALSNLPSTSRTSIEQIVKRLPELPRGIRQGRDSLLTAKSAERQANLSELPELYAAWPYRLVGVTQPGTIKLARDTWDTIPDNRAKTCKQDIAWMPTIVDMAALGMPDEAGKRVIAKLSDFKAPVRFPAFFGPGDWVPDHNWGGSAMVGLQEMLVASEPGLRSKIYLFPAWPKDWDVSFKLHAPGPTVIDCVYRAGKIEKLAVTPTARAKDIVNMLGK